MKIYGMTFVRTHNVGTSLQAYALQETINSLGHHYYVIWHAFSDKGTSPWKTVIREKTFVTIKAVLKNMENAYRYQFFKAFDDKNIHFSEFCNGDKQFQLLNQDADAFVCGSDVIWNPDFGLNDPRYFLEFAQKYRFSYAASFGKSVTEEENQAMLQKYLPQLDGISVREQNAIDIVHCYTDKPVKHVMDPVLLIEKEKWESLADVSSVPKKPYIFVYTTHINPVTLDAIKHIQKQLQLPVIHVTWRIKDMLKQRAFRVPTQPQWIALLSNAEYVVTNSFHGTAFSVLFGKKFITVVDGDATKNSNSRMYSFLSKLGLENRIYSKIDDRVDLTQPDYEYANIVLKEWREESLQYIKDNLAAAEARLQKSSQGENT